MMRLPSVFRAIFGTGQSVQGREGKDRQPSHDASRGPAHRIGRPRPSARLGIRFKSTSTEYHQHGHRPTSRARSSGSADQISSARSSHLSASSHRHRSHKSGGQAAKQPNKSVRTSKSTLTAKSTHRGHLSEASSSHSRRAQPAPPAPPQVVECLICAADEIPQEKSIKLECGHVMCHECVKRAFELSLTDMSLMPPKCCSQDQIPMKLVRNLFGHEFKRKWLRKYEESQARDRIYCPRASCGRWIRPKYIRKVRGSKYAQCPRCSTKVCTTCGNQQHTSGECPKDPAVELLINEAKKEGWQTCYQCHAMVERTEGCNHMRCRCNADFCIRCGKKWKTCDCAWFDVDEGQEDRDVLGGEPVEFWLWILEILRVDVQTFGQADDWAVARERIVERAGRDGNLNQRRQRRQDRRGADLAGRLQYLQWLERTLENRGVNARVPDEGDFHVRMRQHWEAQL